MKVPISTIITTYNEEKNIEECLKSVHGWADEIFVVDSYSNDRTLDICKRYTDKIYQHPFENYGKQANWAKNNLPIKNEWIFYLAADERVTPELARELQDVFSHTSIKTNGFMMSRKTIFMGRWIRHGGHYPTYHLRIFRKSIGKWEERLYSQHVVIEGKPQKLKGDIIDIITSDLTTMVNRLNRWTTLEAEALLHESNNGCIRADLFGNPIERRRWLRIKFYARLPLFLRSFLYFFYRYFLRFGFLDGIRGLIFHVLQGFWQCFLIDAKIYERRIRG